METLSIVFLTSIAFGFLFHLLIVNQVKFIKHEGITRITMFVEKLIWSVAAIAALIGVIVFLLPIQNIDIYSSLSYHIEMKIVKQYTLVITTNPGDLITKVNRSLEQGFQPLGSPTIVAREIRKDMYCQAMVKTKELI